MPKSRLNLALLVLIPVVALLFISCGNSGAASERTVGPVGPTISGYYFDFSLSPSIVRTVEVTTVFVKVSVWDANGLPVSGVTVNFVASNTWSSVTDATGVATSTLEVTGGERMVPLYSHASVEDLELTNYVEVIP